MVVASAPEGKEIPRDPRIRLLRYSGMTPCSGATTAPISTCGADVRFLALSVSDAPEDVIAVIRGGARGYVTKSITGPELAAAVHRVAEGDAVFSPRLAGFVLDAESVMLANKTVNNVLGILGHTLKTAVEWKVIARMPCTCGC